ncbi:MAG: alpha/beta hydrolase [Bowdeniella nasicola]|nr:alpha/beta hydrolase [Bowdeniella nasicola]
MSTPTVPAPVDSWGADLLGPGFVARTLPLADDDEGSCCATLVRHEPVHDPLAHPETPASPHVIVLYLHGWNDYFYHPHLAREIARAGGLTYALDLRKYGRSLRPHHTRGFITDLTTYDEDIHEALRVIREEHGYGIDVVLMGHSTGGLTAALWADRHPGALRALVLNTPWLALQGSPLLKLVTQPVAEAVARRNPHRIFPLPDNGFYFRTIEELGWDFNDEWRTYPSAPVRAGWLSAILAGHTRVQEGLAITCPVLVMTSTRTDFSLRWDETLLGADTVLDVDAIARASLGLGPLVTLARFEGAIHDVFLSRESVRTEVFAELRRWLGAYV